MTDKVTIDKIVTLLNLAPLYILGDKDREFLPGIRKIPDYRGRISGDYSASVFIDRGFCFGLMNVFLKFLARRRSWQE
ncbi:hypothetical protein AXY_03920 [Amphibacillus xylanus NBRC 15112]|uniref:Uncharacterized protein n=1 Tax=Amphibacillus xylanus (strain ATCC 51415 / DSM 6626 / JCM 7361 / LMG 17667 / NBRC 15112 / Ep01) TaxID=698758 RepID=K0IVU0_AMPXN|nr:hypothetical protein AXY_03920 [Amphibacillus xylanus NBRC 15112]